MTVEQLIEQLKLLPPHSKVSVEVKTDGRFTGQPSTFVGAKLDDVRQSHGTGVVLSG